MKTVKIIAILLSVLVFCNALTACAGGNKEQSKQDPVQDEAEQNESTQQPIDDSGQAEREQELRETEKYAYPDYLIGFEEGDDGGQAERNALFEKQTSRTRKKTVLFLEKATTAARPNVNAKLAKQMNELNRNARDRKKKCVSRRKRSARNSKQVAMNTM